MRNIFRTLIFKLLALEASRVLKRRKPKIVTVTGSVGKTSTKDALYTALSILFPLRKNEKSYNSDIGVPLTVLNLKNGWGNPFAWIFNVFAGMREIYRKGDYPTWLVLEVGADKPGDLEDIFSWLVPNVVVVTRFPEVPVHVEFYPSPQALFKEEAIPVRHLPKDGLLALNADDPQVLALSKDFSGRVVTYGFDRNADVVGSRPELLFEQKDGASRPLGIRFRVDYAGSSVPFTINGALGIQHVYPVLAACAVSLTLGANLATLSEAFQSHRTPQGRMRIIEGIKESLIVDDSYNSSPVALAEALSVLKSLTAQGKKIAVLGDMRELGKYSKDEHIKAGQNAASIVDTLVIVGVESRNIALGADMAGFPGSQIFQFEDSREAGKFIKEKVLETGDIVLVKGSQSGIRTERVVEALMLHPELKENLLVRQEPAWLKRK